MSTPTAIQSFTVLRIKRKATEAPLSSLVIHENSDLRARKRREVSVRARGIFRLAETVPGSWEGTGEQNEELRVHPFLDRVLLKTVLTYMGLKTRIEGLLSRTSIDSSTQPLPVSSSPFIQNTPGTSSPSQSTLIAPSQSKAQSQAIASPSTSQFTSSLTKTVLMSSSSILPSDPSPPISNQQQQRYRVIPRASVPTTASKSRSTRDTMGLPPRVLSRAEVEAAKSQLVFVDAQAVSSANEEGNGKGGGADLDFEDAGDEMASFLPMLKEYLSLENRDKPPTRIDPEEAEYVYDLYYRDNRSGAIPDSASASVGALLGYEDLSPPSSISGSEPEDEADEDSNDEDYYANDYPEDEDADEDMVEFGDAYSDGEWSRDEESDGDDERGAWDYR